MTSDPRPIGVFDSGIGGLTVVRELLHRLPGEAITYFGDTARVPYGSKSPATVRRYSQEAAAWLLSQGVKLVVIACNTATAHAADMLRASLPVPVIGVIEPGARAAVRATKTQRIGVIGTSGTIASGAYDLAVRRRLADARVYAQPCPLFVPLVEEGWHDHASARLVAQEYLEPLRSMDVDVVILGCTHYPMLRSLVAEAMGPDVALVDSAAETALEVEALLTERDMRRVSDQPPSHSFAASDAPLRFRDVGRTFIGDVLKRVEQVDVEGMGRDVQPAATAANAAASASRPAR
jgi:glutamate racemase